MPERALVQRRDRIVLLAFMLLALFGCAARSETEQIADWTIRVDAHPPKRIELPTHVALPDRATTFTLTRDVTIPDAWRGRDLRLRIEGWQAIASVVAGGNSLRDEERRTYRGSGYDSWFIRAQYTDVAKLPVTVVVRHTWQKSAWLDGVPTLELAADHSPTSNARATETAGLVMALGTTLSFSFFFGALFLLDRRRLEHGWFALFAAASATYPLFVSTWLESSVGFVEAIIFGSAQASLPVLGYAFSRAMFGSTSVPRRYWALPALVVLVGLLARPFHLAAFSAVATLAIAPPAVAHFVFLMRIARTGDMRARVMLVAWTATTFATSCCEGTYFLGAGLLPFPGVHVGLFANIVLMLVHATLLAARHVESQRSIESLNEELRVSVSKSSEALSRAVWRLVAAYDTSDVRPDEIIDTRYRVVASIGRGGMGQVWRALRLHDGLPVAIKLVRDASSTVALARFAREARIASSMHHPNVVRVFDVTVADRGFMYLVMELVDGDSLSAMRARFGDAAWATQTLRGIVSALVALHARGIVHRDIKPSNVVVRHEHGVEIPMLIDFGLAQNGPKTSATKDDAHFTSEPTTRGRDEFDEPHVVAGTPLYMPPEVVLEGATATAAGDIYSLAVLAHELFVGQPPFDHAPYHRSDATAGPSARRSWGGAPRALAVMLERALSPNPEERPFARDVLVALNRPTLRSATERDHP